MKKANVIHLLILAVMLLLGAWTFLAVTPNVSLQLLVGISTAVAYVVWGIMHHAIQKDLHQKIVIEYILIGAISIVLLVTVLGF